MSCVLLLINQLCVQMEQEVAAEEKNKSKKKGGLKQLFKNCVQGTKNKPFHV